MAQTWTDTTYKLDGTEMTILTTHEGLNQVSLYVPGYSLDGRGFSVYFGKEHIQLLEDLLSKLKLVASSSGSRQICSRMTTHHPAPLPVPVKQVLPMVP